MKVTRGSVFSMDISPWIANPSQWYGAFKMGDFAYMNTSGGGTEARIRSSVSPCVRRSLTRRSIHGRSSRRRG